jgi:hypothetical protein
VRYLGGIYVYRGKTTSAAGEIENRNLGKAKRESGVTYQQISDGGLVLSAISVWLSVLGTESHRVSQSTRWSVLFDSRVPRAKGGR